MKRVLGILFGMLIILSWLVSAFQSCTVTDSSDVTFADEDYEEYDSASPVRKHKRSWLDYYNNENYTARYSVAALLEQQAYLERDGFSVDKWQSDDDFWQQVYYELYNK